MRVWPVSVSYTHLIYEAGKIKARLLDSTVKAGSYSYSFIPKDEKGKELPKITISVKVNGSAVMMNLSASGNINLLTRESSYATVTPSITNQADTIGTIELIGTEAEHFEVKLNEAGKIEIRAKSGAKLETDKTYELSLKGIGKRTGEEFYNTVKVKDVYKRQLLMYRMLSAAGLKTRIITGGNHAWNIVSIDGLWYNLDATWDAGMEGNYQYYLKSDNAFADHYRKEKYKTEAFNVQFPMASSVSYTHLDVYKRQDALMSAGRARINQDGTASRRS